MTDIFEGFNNYEFIIKSKKIKGSLAASLTAFKEDLSLDYNKTISHGEWLLEQGLDGVVFF